MERSMKANDRFFYVLAILGLILAAALLKSHQPGGRPAPPSMPAAIRTQ